MTSEENKTFMRAFVEKAINQKNLSALDDIVSEDFVEHIPFPGQGPGREGLRYAIGAMLMVVPLVKTRWGLGLRNFSLPFPM